MIPISDHFNLGKDNTRIKDQRDAFRQNKTVRIILERMFHEDPDKRWELQLVADEVGMGKTFVALAAAYSVLARMRGGDADPDLKGCAQKVLVISPQNASLATKWTREVAEFVRRCVLDEYATDSAEWFKAEKVDRIDDLAWMLRNPDEHSVIVTQMSVLVSSTKLRHYDLKRRLMLGALFRYWGNRFQNDARARLLKGAPEGWPRNTEELLGFDENTKAKVPFKDANEMISALREMENRDGKDGVVEKLLEKCREIAEPYVRGRDELFKQVEGKLNLIYRKICFFAIQKALPLVIVDEAHNWKNGANGYKGFEEQIAPLTRRALLLTATPFQLCPEEMLAVLKVGSVITPCATDKASDVRRKRLEYQRDQILRPVLENAARQSRSFARAWSRLAPSALPLLDEAWSSNALSHARDELKKAANLDGVVDGIFVERIIESAVVGSDPDIRDILREGLRLYTYNQDLSQELGIFVIRHRRRTDHRLVRIGSEFVAAQELVAQRGDRHVLHAAPGLDVQGEGELPHYLLMRCVSEMKHGRGRTSLGSALTGCYSTLLESADGRTIRNALGKGIGKVYLDLLLNMVGEAQDTEHPKVRAVVDSVLDTWRAGEKTLIFCFRVHTAKRLKQILDDRIGTELRARRDAVFGGNSSLTRLRSRFTRREGDLIVLGLDRVLWSLRWAANTFDVALPGLSADDLRLTDDELSGLARLALSYGVDLRGEQMDRVFVHRAVEHLLARRITEKKLPCGPLFKKILADISKETWVRFAYGLDTVSEESDAVVEDSTDAAGLDERGVHEVYRAPSTPREEDVQELAVFLKERRERALRQNQTPIFDAYSTAPSFWLGENVESWLTGDPSVPAARCLGALHSHLLKLTCHENKGVDWKERKLVFQGLRRALMRESVLLRLLPDKTQLEEQRWGDLLVKSFFQSLPGQHESMADRLAVFVEDLQASAGKTYEDNSSETTISPRQSMYEATRMRDTGFVVLVDGSTANDRRERVFAGFNSPLLPEVLICTTVGQEGIDLHRHCRNVIHYDLAWNPAVLEQRTGRVDRIGSKTFRERLDNVGTRSQGPFLEVGVPFLAGTYDERMYEELRIRAQTFEVLTGGDVSADNAEGSDNQDGAEGAEGGLTFQTLPPTVINDLRVRLNVWEEGELNPIKDNPA